MRHTIMVATVLLLAMPGTGAAQNRMYGGVAAMAHLERADAINAVAPAVAVVGGIRIARSWAVEIEGGRPLGTLVRERTCRCVSFASTPEEFDRLAVTERLRYEREIRTVIAAGVVYAPESIGRWRPRIFVGLSHHRARESSASTILAVPDGFTFADAAAMSPPTSFNRSLGGLAVGAGAAYAASARLSIVPEVRYISGSIGDEINNAWQLSVRALWSF
jgi:hypothetical protein